MILADTSVWIDHFRRREARLVAALEWASVLMHPFVIGELACGQLPDRAVVLEQLGDLPRAPVATHAETLTFIDARRLMGRGLGYIDVHLLASAALGNGIRIWTHDRRLAQVARTLDLGVE